MLRFLFQKHCGRIYVCSKLIKQSNICTFLDFSVFSILILLTSSLRNLGLNHHFYTSLKHEKVNRNM